MAALLVVLAAGCGGGTRPQEAVVVHQIPRALAHDWEGQASEIAAVAAGGDYCRALQLAGSLRKEVDASRAKVPLRLRAPLLSGVNSLANRITCTPPATTPKKPPKPPHERHGDHGHQGHGHGGGNGGGDGGGNDQ